MQKVRIGLIGAGGNTRARHIPGFRGIEGIELVSVANRSPASARRVAEEFDIHWVADDWREILDDGDIDAVCIGTWPYMHAPLTIAALERGKHVLCEARMASELSEARAMLAASRRKPDLVAQIVPAPHTLGFDRTIIDMIGSGDIGELVAVDARVALGSDYPNHDSAPHWRHDRGLSGNNVMSVGIWYESIMRWVGPMCTVFAVGQCVVRHRRAADGGRVAMTIPDHVDIVGTLAQGGQMRLNVTTVAGHAPLPVDILVFGTEGTLRLQQAASGAMQLLAARRGGSGLTPVSIAAGKSGRWRVEEEFVNAIRGREIVTHTDFATGVRYMAWTDAVAQSLADGARVAVPLA